MTTPDAAASAVAAAFLDADWADPGALASNAADVLGARATTLWPVAAEVLRFYRHAPLDRPRELAAFIGETATFARAWRRSLHRRRIRRWPLPAVASGRRRWPVPDIATVGDLADLLGLTTSQLSWYADVRSVERHSDVEPLRHYRYTWSRTRRGHPRLVEAPKPRLRAMQRQLLHDVLDVIPAHDSAHGFVAGRSAVGFAAAHVGRDVVVHADLESFFASISAGRIFAVWRSAGYAEPVAHALTGLATNTVPTSVRRSAPRALHDDDVAPRRRLLQRIAAPHLPPGAPTSPALANLVAWRLDVRLRGLAESAGAVYTRYADDLAFSLSGRGSRARAARLLALTDTVVADEGFRLNAAKSVVATRAQRQLLAGVVVNAKTSVPRADVDRLRATLHNCRVHGPESQNRDGRDDYRAHLLGRVSWVAAVDPRRGEQLRSMFDAIAW